MFDEDATQEASAVTDNLTRSIDQYCNEHPTAIADFFVKKIQSPYTTHNDKNLVVDFFFKNKLAFDYSSDNIIKLQRLVTEYYRTHNVQEDTQIYAQLDLSLLNHAPIELAEIHFSALLTQFYTKEILQ